MRNKQCKIIITCNRRVSFVIFITLQETTAVNFKAMPQPSFEKIFRPQLKHEHTEPKPFSFIEKDKERWQKKEEKIQDVYKEEEKVKFKRLDWSACFSYQKGFKVAQHLSFMLYLAKRIQSSTVTIRFAGSIASCCNEMWYQHDAIFIKY